MKATVIVCAAVLSACGPEKGGSSTGSGSSSGDDGTGVEPTSAPTGGELGSTGALGSSGELGSTGEAGSTSETGDSLSVYPVATIVGRPSALEGVPRWPFDPQAQCVVSPESPCGVMPALGAAKFLINGVFAEPETIAIGSHVAALFAFEHAGCGLACGSTFAGVDDGVEGEGSGGSNPADLPCSTQASGLWLALDFGEIQRAGLHTGQVRMIDVCETPTELREVAFSVQ